MTTKRIRLLGFPAFKNCELNSYCSDFYNALIQHDITVDEFTFWRALSKRYDIIHVHWPEKFLNSNYLIKATVWSAMLLICLKIHQIKGGKIIWTAHNLKPHEIKYPRCSRIFWPLFLRMVNATFSLSYSNQKILFDTVELPKATHHKIIHLPLFHKPDADNIDSILGCIGISQTKPYCLFFGRILPYKNVEALIDIFKSNPPSNVNLVIAGSCESSAYKDELEARTANASNIKFIGRRTTDVELLALIQGCAIGIVPFKAIFNSASLLQFPSYGKPAMTPYSDNFAEYGNLFETSPFVLYKGSLTKDIIEHAITNLPTVDKNCPKELTTKEVAIHAAEFFHEVAKEQ